MDRWSESTHSATEKEIASEKAASLGRAGTRLQRALYALQSFDSGTAGNPDERQDLLDEAGEALFFYVVQREACGLRDTAEVLREFSVPAEVQRRMRLRPRSNRR